MKLKYFADTETALLECNGHEIVETREIGEHLLADLDEHGNLVSLTLEHARAHARLPEFEYEEVDGPVKR